MLKFFSIPKNTLLLIAALAWCLAGAMVSKIGLPLLWGLGAEQPLLYLLAAVCFLLFYRLIFSRLVAKHSRRIREQPAAKLPFWDFFDLQSYIVMVIMISGGIWLRRSQSIPSWAIAFLYSGIGVALFACGTRFLAAFLRKDALRKDESPAVALEAAD